MDRDSKEPDTKSIKKQLNDSLRYGIEVDAVINMPPIDRFTIEVEVKEIKKGKLNIIDPDFN